MVVALVERMGRVAGVVELTVLALLALVVI